MESGGKSEDDIDNFVPASLSGLSLLEPDVPSSSYHAAPSFIRLGPPLQRSLLYHDLTSVPIKPWNSLTQLVQDSTKSLHAIE